MSNKINVRLTENDVFIATDPDTGAEKSFPSIVFHNPLKFIADISVKRHMLEAFPGKTEWDCSAAALERIRNICDFNCLTDEFHG